MPIFIFQNVAFLTLAALGIYAVFVNSNLSWGGAARQVLLGVLLGLVALLVIGQTAPFDSIQVQIALACGYIVLAGFLGGWIGGLIAAGLGALALVLGNEAGGWVGAAFVVGFAVLGVAVQKGVAPDVKSQVPRKAIGLLVGGAVVLSAVAGWTIGTESTLPLSAPVMGGLCAVIGALSTGIFAVLVHSASLAGARTARDTERARAFDLASRALNLGVSEHDADAALVHFDTETSKIMGVDPSTSTFVYRDWKKFVVPEDHDNLATIFEHMWQGNPPNRPTLFRIIRPDGEIRNVQGFWSTQPNDGSPVEHVTGIYQDVTYSLKLQREKISAERRLAQVIENLPGALHSIDIAPDGKISINYISPYCLEIWGYTSDELMANPVLMEEMHDPNDLADMMMSFRYAAKTLKPINRRISITSRTGEAKWLDMHSSATRLENGAAQIDSIFLDVTAEVTAQKQLELQMHVANQAQKYESIGQLTGGVAHDFNNLLAVIMGNLELLREDLLDHDQRSLIDAGIAATQRGAGLTRAMLAFARKASLTPSVIDLNQLVRDTKNWSGRTLPASIHVETELFDGLWAIKADPNSTESALLNLILNARNAMQDGGTLTIETANVHIQDTYVDERSVELRPGRYVMLAVSDTGHGIPKDLLEQIFEPFFSTQGPGEGSGLGLSMIHGFMHQSGGTVHVYSEEGVGTTFKLFFVAYDAEATPAEQFGVLSESENGSGRILVVEDQGEVLSVIVRLLEKAGYDVTPTRSGDEAWALINSGQTFDLVLTDIVMPGELLGTDLAKKIREDDPSQAIVFMSGYASEATVHGNGLQPSDIRLMKPIQRSELLAAVHRALTEPHS